MRTRTSRLLHLDLSELRGLTPGAKDEEVLARCSDEQRTLLTFDKDFGEIAFRRGLPVPCGVVPFRVVPQSPSEIAEVALAAMSAQSAWEGHFSVVTRERIRVTPLPRK